MATNRILAGNQYLTTLTIYFIGYVLFEVRTLALVAVSCTKLAGSVKSCTKTYISKIMASNSDSSLGCFVNSHGSDTELFWIFGRPILLGRCRKGIIPWG